MPSKEELKRRAFQEIDDRADEIIGLAQTILKNPEPVYVLLAQRLGVGPPFTRSMLPGRTYREVMIIASFGRVPAERSYCQTEVLWSMDIGRQT